MDQETKYKKQIEAMGFDIEIETDDGVSEVWITNNKQAYCVKFWNGEAHVIICGTGKRRRFGWYESALHFIIKHHLGL
jgi:hypothetical protein